MTVVEYSTLAYCNHALLRINSLKHNYTCDKCTRKRTFEKKLIDFKDFSFFLILGIVNYTPLKPEDIMGTDYSSRFNM